MLLLIGPMEGVMNPEVVGGINALRLTHHWVTPFLRISQNIPSPERISVFLAPFRATGVPVTLQLMGNDPDLLGATAQRVRLDLPGIVQGIDLNCGCPSRQVFNGGAGGGLLRDLGRLREIVHALREATRPELRFSVKIRVGFSDDGELEPLIDAIGSAPTIDFLTCHCRTVREGYQTLPPALRQARLQRVAQAAALYQIPVVANGDIATVEDAKAVLATPNIEGVMAGRGFFRDPWLLNRIAAAILAPENDATPAPPPAEARQHLFAAIRQREAELPEAKHHLGADIELARLMFGGASPEATELKHRFALQMRSDATPCE